MTLKYGKCLTYGKIPLWRRVIHMVKTKFNKKGYVAYGFGYTDLWYKENRRFFR